MVDILISTIKDGSMKSIDGQWRGVLPNRTKFLNKHGLKPDNTTLVQLVYEGNDYCRYHTVQGADKGDGIVRQTSIVADGLVTTEPGHALLLPLADCIGAVMYDSRQNILMLTHLGRHNLIQLGGTKSVEYLAKQFDCKLQDLTVFLGPAAGGQNYPLFSFDNRSMHDVATEQLVKAGVKLEQITISDIDTTTSPDYFSHSEFLKGHRSTDGRFAIVAVMR